MKTWQWYVDSKSAFNYDCLSQLAVKGLLGIKDNSGDKCEEESLE